MAMTREEFATKFAQKGIMGMTRDGDLDDIIAGGGSVEGVVKKVNGKEPNANGEVVIPVGTDNLGTVTSVNGVVPNGTGDLIVNVGVKTIHGTAPDSGGNWVDPGRLHIVHKNSMATYTPVASDNGAYMVFDYEGDMVITLPSALKAPEDAPFTMFVVNTKGRIDIETTEPFIGFAKHVAQGVTCGLLRGMTNWYASGTNNKEELS